jgi:hypothetical protein
MTGDTFLRTFSIARKEMLHILRDPQTLFFTLFVPVMELFMLGYAIDTNVRNVRTAVVDLAGTQESRQLLEQFENSGDFKIIHKVYTIAEAEQLIVAGKARVAIVVPEDYSRRLEAGESAEFLVLVDGTESSIAAEAVNVSNAIALRESLARIVQDGKFPIDARPTILFNPDTRSANFFIPGLMVVMCQMMSTVLSANAIVREKELGTLEQLYMTPVRRGELIIGKMGAVYRPHTRGVLLHCISNVVDFPRADSRPLHHAHHDHVSLCARQSRHRSVDFDEGRNAGSSGTSGDGNLPALDLPLGLRLSARLNALAAAARGQLDSHHLADRRFTQRDPPRRRLAGVMAARARPLGNGHCGDALWDVADEEAAVANHK